MRAAWRRLATGWIVVAVCAGAVLLAGARLMVLSLRESARQTHIDTQRLADRDAAALRGQLQALTALAAQRAAAAVQAASYEPGRNEFWLASDGRVLGSPTDYRTADDIAQAWSRSASVAGARLLGPLREDNRWLVAVRAPLEYPQGNGGTARIGWSVVYRDIAELLGPAQLDRVRQSGYDFQLAQIDAEGRSVIFASSAAAPLVDPVASPIALPADASGTTARGGWALMMRPRAGWLPGSALAVDLSLLMLVTWLVALGVRDGMRHFMQLRSALSVSRRRLQDAHRKLAQEIERRDQLQKSFDHAHFHDAFTGLPNRQFFLGRLDRALRELRGRPERRLAVLLIAIERYKAVTDTLGHTAGDELMLQITREFDRALATQNHALARWADDELALLLPDEPDAAALPEAARLLRLALQTPIELRRHRVLVGSSIGATLVDSGLRRTEEVMREADIALSTTRVRGGGGASFAVYSASMQANLLQLVSVEADLEQALERDEFRLLFQPIVDLRARRVVGVEALLRWSHPTQGLLAPEHFLGMAEETGLLVPITRWIIGRVCELSRQWRPRLPAGCAFYISVNLSPGALLDPELEHYLGRALEMTGTPPATLKFELNEAGLISDAGAARNALDRLHAMGIELMLDDFGTGYSSLSHLQFFPFDYIKIEGPFDSNPGPAQGHAALVRAITLSAATLGLKTIAEVVETTSAIETLEQIGCQFAQGNVFCAPVDAEQAMAHLCRQELEPMQAANESQPEDTGDSPTLILPPLPESAVPWMASIQRS
jgi:diguanylate cyclase (GGDEF)-like protein